MNKKTFYPMLCGLLNSSFLWIGKTVSRENRKKTIEDIAKENGFNLDEVDQSNPFNPALLFAGAYLFFLYQRECDPNFTSVNTSYFVVKEGNKRNLARRLRNSIAHGNYTFLDGNIIEFTDSDRGNNVVKFQISMGNFGNFINDCLSNVLKD